MAVTCLPGESPHPHAWADEHVGRVGSLLRRLHDATAGFSPPERAAWQPTWLRDLPGSGPADDVVIGHCDAGLPDAAARAGQLCAILDGYGLPRARRPELVDRMVEVAVHSARAEAVLADVTPDSTHAVSPDGYPVLWAVTWRARSASWMIRHRRLLLDAVS